ncbi:MAG: FadR family transcriptional regulator [Planctomycetes bacterium]|nr:FadR family transcriptional regulator [Planctomycetota bacterium]
MPRARALDTVAGELRQNILAGAWAIGARLPPQRDLAHTFEVSRLTVREAVERLEGEGLLDVRHGDGVVVRDFRQSGGLDLLSELLRYGDEKGRLPAKILRDLFDLRTALAVEGLRLVRRRPPAAARALLEENLCRQAAALGDAAAVIPLDLEFTRNVIRAFDNIGMEILFNAILRVLSKVPRVLAALFADPRLNYRSSRAVFACLAKGASPARVATVRARLARLDRACLAALGPAQPQTPTPFQKAPSREPGPRTSNKDPSPP